MPVWSSVILIALAVAGFARPAPAQDRATGPALVRAMPSDGLTCTPIARLSPTCDAIRARTILDAASDPWHMIGRVNHADIATRMHCTGTLVAENVVLTAAHCLHDEARDRWFPAQDMVFAAGYQRGKAVAVATGVSFLLAPDFRPVGKGANGRFRQDWALLVLDRPLGRDLGFLAVMSPGDDLQDGAEYQVIGYSGLRPHVLSRADDCGPPQGDALKDGLVLQRCSVMAGDSGAPVVLSLDGRMRLAGVLVGSAANGADRYSVSVSAGEFAASIPAAAAR